MHNSKGELVRSIVSQVAKCRDGDIERREVAGGTPEATGRNEFLFFTKPEIQDTDDEAVMATRLELVFDKVAGFQLEPAKILVISGRYLDRHNIIGDHYGVIDGIARDPVSSISENGTREFENQYGCPIESVRCAGGLEYMQTHSGLSPKRLSEIWLEGDYRKLAGGTYCLYLPDENLYLFNGFYPRLYDHFTSPDATIVAIILRGDIGWRDARTRFIGSTDPSKAEPGSLREVFLTKRKELLIPEISPNLNGAHLSAGPVEALAELVRFTADRSDSSRSAKSRPEDFAFGRMLRKHFDEEEINAIISNEDVVKDGKTISIFDLTEELDSDEAVSRLLEAFT